MESRAGAQVPDIRKSEEGVFLFANGLERIACPHCRAIGKVTDRLEPGEVCPQCKRGAVRNDGTCIY